MKLINLKINTTDWPGYFNEMAGCLQKDQDLTPGKDRVFYFNRHNWTGPGVISHPMQKDGCSLLILRRPECDANHSNMCCVEERNNWKFRSSCCVHLRGGVLSFPNTFACWYDC